MKVNELERNQKSRLNTNLSRCEFKSIIDASTMKKSIGIDIQTVFKTMMEKVVNNLIEQFRGIDPKAPDEIIKAFIETYIDLSLSYECDVKNLSYEVIVTPVWKDVHSVDTTSESFQLLTEYAFQE